MDHSDLRRLPHFEEGQGRLIQLLIASIPTADVRQLKDNWPAPAEGMATPNSKADAASGLRPPVTLELLEYDSDGEVTSTVAKCSLQGA